MNSRIQIGRNKLGFYSFVSYFVCLGGIIYFALQLDLLGSQNIIEFHVVAGHWISEVAMVCLVTIYGYRDILKGVYAAAFLFCLHEAVFMVMDGIYLGRLLDVIGSSWPLMAFYIMMLIGYFVNFRVLPRRTEILVVVMLAVFYALWWNAGFDISSANFLGVMGTNHIASLDVNLNEVIGWVVPALTLMVYRPNPLADHLAEDSAYKPSKPVYSSQRGVTHYCVLAHGFIAGLVSMLVRSVPTAMRAKN